MQIRSIIKKIPGSIFFHKTIQKIIQCFYYIFFSIKASRYPQVIVRVDGGLGSQMWQYALGQAISEACKLPVKYDIQWFKENGKDLNNKHKRNFDLLKVFSERINFPIAKKAEINFYSANFSYQNTHIYEYIENILYSKKTRYLSDYYSNIHYIQNIREKIYLFFTPVITFSEQMRERRNVIQQTPNAVAVHIRRGDYVNSIFDVTTPVYFHLAQEHMRSLIGNPTFFVFSNDIEYAKQFCIKTNHVVHFIDETDNDTGYEDLFLMKECRHFIISNSSFGWWAAILSDSSDKVVIAPEKWIADTAEDRYKKYSETAMIDSNWITIKV